MNKFSKVVLPLGLVFALASCAAPSKPITKEEAKAKLTDIAAHSEEKASELSNMLITLSMKGESQEKGQKKETTSTSIKLGYDIEKCYVSLELPPMEEMGAINMAVYAKDGYLYNVDHVAKEYIKVEIPEQTFDFKEEAAELINVVRENATDFTNLEELIKLDSSSNVDETVEGLHVVNKYELRSEGEGSLIATNYTLVEEKASKSKQEVTAKAVVRNYLLTEYSMKSYISFDGSYMKVDAQQKLKVGGFKVSYPNLSSYTEAHIA